MTTSSVVRLLAIVCIGLLAGIYLADRASAPARTTLDASSFVQYQQTVHTTYVKMMPPLLIGAILSALVWIFLERSQWRDAEFWLVAVSLCAIVFVGAVSRAVNVPLNDQLMTWSTAAPPANLKEIWAPWERVDAIRTVAAIGAFILQALAMSLKVSAASHSSNVSPAP